MKTRFISFLLLLAMSCGAFAQSSYQPTEENLKAREEFQDNKFGIFLHWGLYAMLATGEWTMTNINLNYKEYAKLAGGFYPSKFDADKWVQSIKASGARYICFTTRHHEGFSMFDTKYSDYNVVKAKYEQGTVSEYDKISADVQMRSLKPTVVSARNGVNLANLQLKVLMGMESDVKVAVEGNLKDYEMSMFTRQAMPRPDNLTNNSTLKQLELNALQLKQTLKLQYTNFMPTLSASFQYMYTSMNDNFKFKEYDWRPYSTIGLNLSIPLFKGSNFTQLKQTRIQMKQLEENRINTERQLTMQATGYLDNMAASTEQVVSNKEAVFQAEKGRTIAEKRYEVGKGTILELNSSEVALTEAQLTYNQSIYDYLVAKADLDLVLGIDEVTEQ